MKRTIVMPTVALVAGIAAGIIGNQAVTAQQQLAPAKSIEAQSERLPIADLHVHLGPVFWPNLSPQDILGIMDRAGVRWAGNGPAGPDDIWLPFLQVAPDRFIPFAGRGPIRRLIQDQGEDAWALRSPEIIRVLVRLEDSLRAGPFHGIGELHVNNMSSANPRLKPMRWPADSPLMKRLLALAATYQAPLDIHMDAEPASVEELERLLPSNRKGVIIWAHCGWSRGDAGLIRKMLAQNPNLFCELSQRDDRPRLNPEVRRRLMITDDGRQLKPEWKSLLEEHSDRFLIGTDSGEPGAYQGIVDFFRAVLAQLKPEAAMRIAYENARQLFRLSQAR